MHVQRELFCPRRLFDDDGDGLREGLRRRTHILERPRRQLSKQDFVRQSDVILRPAAWQVIYGHLKHLSI